MNKQQKTDSIKKVYQQLLVKKKISSYEVAKQTGIDKAYLSKLARGAIKKPGQDKLFKIASVLDIELKQLQKVFAQPEVASVELGLGELNLASAKTVVNPRQDWGSAPDNSICYGRETEIATLEQWIISDRISVVTLYGLSGMGKTTLAIEITQQLQREFDYIFWRNLHRTPSIEIMIKELLKLFKIETVECSYREQMSQLFSRLRTFRCLLVFDRVESILTTDNYRLYGEFLTQLAESQHNSCLLLVSNEKPKDLAIRECTSAAVRSLQLKGLDKAARDILEDKELSEEERWDDLIEAYRGHPLALKIVATTIKELFDGNVSEFLSQNTLFLGDLAFILHQEYQRLSDLEKKIICMIVDSDRPIALVQIKKQFNKKIRSSDLMSCLDILTRRSLLEVNRVKSSTFYSLHPVIKKYLNTQC